MTNKQKIEKWLDKQIKAEQTLNTDLKINNSLTLQNASGKDYIHLYGCLHQVAKILGVDVVQTEPSRLSSGKLYAEDYFMYKGIKFIQVVS